MTLGNKGFRDRSGRDRQPGKRRVEYAAAVQLQMREAGGPLTVIRRIGKGWSEQHARGPARGGGWPELWPHAAILAFMACAALIFGSLQVQKRL